MKRLIPGQETRFDPLLELDDDEVIHKLISDLWLSCRKENIDGMKVLAGNLVAGSWKGFRLVIPMNHRISVHRRYDPPVSSVHKRLFRIMNKKGYVIMKKGFCSAYGGRSFYTRAWATERFLRSIPIEVPFLRYRQPKELVELRDRATGLFKPYRDNSFTRRVRSVLRRTNLVNSSATVDLNGQPLSVLLTAIFLDDFSKYGRLHSRGFLHYQGVSRDQRLHVTINREPTVELDFRGLHPHLLYARAGAQWRGGDPYVTACPSASIRGRATKLLRPFFKVVLLSMMNSGNFSTAEKAVNYWLANHPEDRAFLRQLGITRARPVMERFLEVHRPIAPFLLTDGEEGLRIMNLDAQIALDVVDHFSGQGVPILPVHDSFIVPASFREELKQKMIQSYSNHTGGYSITVH